MDSEPAEPLQVEGDAEQLELDALSSARSIVNVALPACLMNVAPPATIVLQTALIGRFASTNALAAFAAAGVMAFATRAFNYLVDGVSSKVGAAVGAGAWAELGTDVALSVRWSAMLGVAAIPLLLLARVPLLGGVLAVEEQVLMAATPYWRVRTAAVPFQLLSMAAAGILQGFGHVRWNAGLTSAAAVLETAGSAAVLVISGGGGGGSGSGSGSLLALGFVTLACQALLAAAALACVARLPPAEAKGRVRLSREVLGLSPAAAAPPSSAEEPLLGGGVQPDSSRLGWLLLDAPTRKFLRDGASMFARTCILQLTFVLALAAAARLGTAALAAHGVVGQLWVVLSYLVDGFAAAGIVLGSRLAGCVGGPPRRAAAAERNMRRLTARVLWAGGLCGAAAGAALFAGRRSVPGWFTSDPAVIGALQRGGVWEVLAATQPLNGLLFVFDGLMYSTQAFTYVRNYMALGFALVFCPALAAAAWAAPPGTGLAAIWLAKGALNVWRLGGAAYLIYWRFLPRFGQGGGAAAGEAAAEPAA